MSRRHGRLIVVQKTFKHKLLGSKGLPQDKGDEKEEEATANSQAFSPSPIDHNQPPQPLIPLKHWNEHFAWPPPGGLRHIKFHEDTNGFEGVFFKCGDTVLVDPVLFWKKIREGAGR